MFLTRRAALAALAVTTALGLSPAIAQNAEKPKLTLGVGGKQLLYYGSFLPIPAIAAGVIAGGAISIGVGYWSFAAELPEWWRFISLLIGSLSLVFVGYRQWRYDRP